jgi:3-methylfumaryl-CoA hydratase
MSQTDTDFDDWVGRSDQRTDVVTVAPLWGFHDALDYTHEPKPGEPIPPGAHWCYFHPHVPMKEVGPDGHPKRGGFMPDPAGLPRRMFAGAHMDFVGAIRVGDTVTRTQEIVSVVPKSGKTGRLLFVSVRETYAGPRGVEMVQKNDIVYREPAEGGTNTPPPPKIAPTSAQWSRTVTPDPVMLFKYSAVTLNGHRIHYDRPYAMEVEGYPGLVVHGPLIGTLLMDLCRRERPKDKLASFSFRAVAPIFDTAPFSVNAAAKNGSADEWTLWAANDQGHLCMQGEATFG